MKNLSKACPHPQPKHFRNDYMRAYDITKHVLWQGFVLGFCTECKCVLLKHWMYACGAFRNVDRYFCVLCYKNAIWVTFSMRRSTWHSETSFEVWTWIAAIQNTTLHQNFYAYYNTADSHANNRAKPLPLTKFNHIESGGGCKHDTQ